MRTIENRFVIGPSNILSASMYVCTLQPGNFTGFGSEGVKQSLVRAGDVIRLECMCFPWLVRSRFFLACPVRPVQVTSSRMLRVGLCSFVTDCQAYCVAACRGVIAAVFFCVFFLRASSSYVCGRGRILIGARWHDSFITNYRSAQLVCIAYACAPYGAQSCQSIWNRRAV